MVETITIESEEDIARTTVFKVEAWLQTRLCEERCYLEDRHRSLRQEFLSEFLTDQGGCPGASAGLGPYGSSGKSASVVERVPGLVLSPPLGNLRSGILPDMAAAMCDPGPNVSQEVGLAAEGHLPSADCPPSEGQRAHKTISTNPAVVKVANEAHLASQAVEAAADGTEKVVNKLVEDAHAAAGVATHQVHAVDHAFHTVCGQKTSRHLGAVEKPVPQRRSVRYVKSAWFEVAFGLLILCNAVCIAVEVQYRGMLLGHDLRSRAAVISGGGEQVAADWRGLPPTADDVFRSLELFFGVVFTLEVIVKGGALRARFFLSGFNVFDLFLVGLWIVEAIILATSSPGPSLPHINPMLLRLCRLVRLMRLVRLVKVAEMFDTLMLMISSIKASFSVLMWGTMILLLGMLICALCMNSVLQAYMRDDSVDIVDRQHVFDYFGSFTRCMVTMFEITVGNWVAPCRLLMRKVGEGYAIFFLAYKMLMGFAVVKVITGVFLHETFRCASLDDELMIATWERARLKFSDKMLHFFREADISGDGRVSELEFTSLLRDQRVKSWMRAMDFNIRDPEAVFMYLIGEHRFRRAGCAELAANAEITAEELVRGMSRLRGSAQEFDVLTLLEECCEIRSELATYNIETRALIAELAERGVIPRGGEQKLAGASGDAAAPQERERTGDESLLAAL